MTTHIFGIRHHGPGSTRSLIRALDELGYKGVVSVEPFEPAGSRLRALPLEEALQVVADSVKEVFAQAGIA